MNHSFALRSLVLAIPLLGVALAGCSGKGAPWNRTSGATKANQTANALVLKTAASTQREAGSAAPTGRRQYPQTK